MKQEDLMKALTDIDEKWIEEAAPADHALNDLMANVPADDMDNSHGDTAMPHDSMDDGGNITPFSSDMPNPKLHRYRSLSLVAAACLVCVIGLQVANMSGMLHKNETAAPSDSQQEVAVTGTGNVAENDDAMVGDNMDAGTQDMIVANSADSVEMAAEDAAAPQEYAAPLLSMKAEESLEAAGEYETETESEVESESETESEHDQDETSHTGKTPVTKRKTATQNKPTNSKK